MDVRGNRFHNVAQGVLYYPASRCFESKLRSTKLLDHLVLHFQDAFDMFRCLHQGHGLANATSIIQDPLLNNILCIVVHAIQLIHASLQCTNIKDQKRSKKNQHQTYLKKCGF